MPQWDSQLHIPANSQGSRHSRCVTHNCPPSTSELLPKHTANRKDNSLSLAVHNNSSRVAATNIEPSSPDIIVPHSATVTSKHIHVGQQNSSHTITSADSNNVYSVDAIAEAVITQLEQRGTLIHVIQSQEPTTYSIATSSGTRVGNPLSQPTVVVPTGHKVVHSPETTIGSQPTCIPFVSSSPNPSTHGTSYGHVRTNSSDDFANFTASYE